MKLRPQNSSILRYAMRRCTDTKLTHDATPSSSQPQLCPPGVIVSAQKQYISRHQRVCVTIGLQPYEGHIPPYPTHTTTTHHHHHHPQRSPRRVETTMMVPRLASNDRVGDLVGWGGRKGPSSSTTHTNTPHHTKSTPTHALHFRPLNGHQVGQDYIYGAQARYT